MNKIARKGLGLALLCVIALVGLNISRVRGDYVVVISGDGSVSPAGTPIYTSDNVTYTLTGDINGSIYVERSNVILNGAGHVVGSLGSGQQVGIWVDPIDWNLPVNNVTISDLRITGQQYGVALKGTSDCTISNCNFVGNTQYAIWADSCPSRIRIIDNNITDCYSYPYGAVLFMGGTDFAIIGNRITKSVYGIWLFGGSNGIVSNNIISSINATAIVFVDGTQNCTFSENTITKNPLGSGFCLGQTTDDNTISNNLIEGNGYGLWELTGGTPHDPLNYIVNNTIRNNDFINNNVGVQDGYLDRGVISDRIYHNNFINNTIQTLQTSVNNTWDNGYPSGGNYWSDYGGVDSFRGPYQNITGSDGIGDSPYNVSQTNSDKYPFMHSARAHIEAYCLTENTSLSVAIAIDGLSTMFKTSHAFNVMDSHEFTVPNADSNGHFFKQWNTGQTSTTITVASNGTYIAYYQAKYNLTILDTAGGSTSQAIGNHTFWDGTQVYVTATSNLGYVYSGWKLDGIDVGLPFNPIMLTMNRSCTLQALFTWVGICNLTIITSGLPYYVHGGDTFPAEGQHSYTNGTQITIIAVRTRGLAPWHWEMNGTVYYGATITVTMNTDHELLAVFGLMQIHPCPSHPT